MTILTSSSFWRRPESSSRKDSGPWIKSRVTIMIMLTAVLLASPAHAQKRVPETQTEIKLSFAPLVRTAAPAVVNIFTRKTVTTRSFSPLFDDPFFRRFFGDQFRSGKRSKKKFRTPLVPASSSRQMAQSSPIITSLRAPMKLRSYCPTAGNLMLKLSAVMGARIWPC